MLLIVLLKLRPSLKTGQETMHPLLHLKHPASDAGGWLDLVDPDLALEPADPDLALDPALDPAGPDIIEYSGDQDSDLPDPDLVLEPDFEELDLYPNQLFDLELNLDLNFDLVLDLDCDLGLDP